MRGHSLNYKITSMLIVASVFLGIVSAVVGFAFYESHLMAHYRTIAQDTSKLAAAVVRGDDVGTYLAQGKAAEGYDQARVKLRQIARTITGVAYVYVYQVREDGCHVVLDLDMPDLPADAPGSVVGLDPGYAVYRDDLLAGREVPPIFTNDEFSWLLTAYTPIRDHAGRTVAYACVDIAMAQYVKELLVYGIKLAAMLFGIILVLAAFALWFAQRRLVEPIGSLLDQAGDFKQSDPEEWLRSKRWLQYPQVRTGDEIEELYSALCEAEQEVAHKVVDLRKTQSQLQESAAIKQKNEELALAVKRADEANVAKTVFLSNVSHDMRTPLNAIIGFSRLDPGRCPAGPADFIESIVQCREIHERIWHGPFHRQQ